ncbi:TA0938 family protein [Sulfurisphaera javensis]|uniref:TA0938 family protein n=1 Tax=Sulfurisphaera javensis TaxID=2049879 RepID=A0AAT9GQ92_9CREN
MKIIVNGKEAGSKETGCALCGATWGEYYEEIEGQRLFFCCDFCALEFKNMINEVKKRTCWERIDELTINGNYYTGRTCIAKHNEKEYKFYVKFNEEGEIGTFKEL